MDIYREMYWKLYHQVSQVIEELEAVKADTEALFLERAAEEERDRDAARQANPPEEG